MNALGDALDKATFRNTRLAVPFSEIPAIAPDDLWPGVIPRRTPVMWAGPGKTGKGLAIAAVAGIVTTGQRWPGEPEGTVHKPGGVILVAPEDDPNEDLVFRLRAAGANLERVWNLTVLPNGDDFWLPDNSSELHRAITEMQQKTGTVLVALDPLMAMTNSVGSAKAARAITGPLQEIARETGAAMIVSHHTTKDDITVAGSKSLTDAFRAVWLARRADPDDQDDPRRVLECWRANRETAGAVPFLLTGHGTDSRAIFMEPGAEAAEEMMPERRAAKLRMTEPEQGASGPLAMWQRHRLVLTLISADCPEGDGPAGRSCTEPGGSELCRLDTGVIAHASRIAQAVADGRVTRETVIAQFGGRLPDELKNL